ncbi:translation initiation factor IF-2-like [Choloepus didactylus]|uniref:translation initiation factor IF-2-like n=1 Tax=Choloepus didactylus TaxID=27675 RepID=UPI00189D4FF4|nr:translation initiation factor IF-2-like [Choloepus didactylus]
MLSCRPRGSQATRGRRPGASAQNGYRRPASPTHRAGLVTGHTKEPAAAPGHDDSPRGWTPHVIPARPEDSTRRKIRINTQTCCTFGSLSPRNERGRSGGETRAARTLRAEAGARQATRKKGAVRGAPTSGALSAAAGWGRPGGSAPPSAARPRRPTARTGEESQARCRLPPLTFATRPRGLRSPTAARPGHPAATLTWLVPALAASGSGALGTTRGHERSAGGRGGRGGRKAGWGRSGPGRRRRLQSLTANRVSAPRCVRLWATARIAQAAGRPPGTTGEPASTRPSARPGGDGAAAPPGAGRGWSRESQRVPGTGGWACRGPSNHPGRSCGPHRSPRSALSSPGGNVGPEVRKSGLKAPLLDISFLCQILVFPFLVCWDSSAHKYALPGEGKSSKSHRLTPTRSQPCGPNLRPFRVTHSATHFSITVDKVSPCQHLGKQISNKIL